MNTTTTTTAAPAVMLDELARGIQLVANSRTRKQFLEALDEIHPLGIEIDEHVHNNHPGAPWSSAADSLDWIDTLARDPRAGSLAAAKTETTTKLAGILRRLVTL